MFSWRATGYNYTCLWFNAFFDKIKHHKHCVKLDGTKQEHVV